MKNLVTMLALLAICTAARSEDNELYYEHIESGIEGSANTSRYWDCCKPTCSWPGNILFDSPPVYACKADGVTVQNDRENQSGCLGGDSFTCSNYVGTIINENLAYGFAAAGFINVRDPEKCCACFELTFKEIPYNKQVGGKKLIVQVINTGGPHDVHTDNTFDLQMPGGGVGYFNAGCKKQWNAPEDGWGERYGGVTTEKECYELPAELQKGCLFRFQFFGEVSNPPAYYKEVTCPAVLTKASGCTYKDK